MRLYPREQKVGTSFQVFCSTQEGSTPLFFEWAKNGQQIKSSPNVNNKIENSELSSTFIIKKVEKGDSANYTCTVTNSVGSDSQTVNLLVKGRSLF